MKTPADPGPFYDEVRAQRAVDFFEKLLVHTKGVWARRPFVLAPWQKPIIEDLFGTVRWDDQYRLWVRQYRTAWIELGRGQGKSEIMAACGLLLLCADDEEQAEVYGAAADRDQASLVFDVAKRMVELGPLRKELKVIDSRKRIVHPRTGSVYQVISPDAAGNLGQNPHGILFDEVIAQKNRDLWDALKTGMGKRVQPLMIAATTAGPDTTGFAYDEHRFSERVAEDQSLDPTRYVFMRNTHRDLEPFDEANWLHANPALGDYLSAQTLRDEAKEAQENPASEARFRQYRLNQWGHRKARFIASHVWAEQAGSPVRRWQDYEKQVCWGGLDLGAVSDMTAFVLVFPEAGPECTVCGATVSEAVLGEHVRVYRRLWIPEAEAEADPTGVIGRFAERKLVTVTPGNVTDYRQVVGDITKDAERFQIESLALDYAFQGIQVAQTLEEEGVPVTRFRSGYRQFAEPMVQFERRVRHRGVHHGGDPVLGWMAENLVVTRNSLDYMMPAKDRSDGKIDGIVALIMAIGEMAAGASKRRSAYETRGLEVV